MTVLLLTSDLAVFSRVEGAVMRQGATMATASTAAAAIESCQAQSPRLLVIDLETASRDVESLVAQAKAAAIPPRIIAFGPHVHVNKLEAAREAGCDEVLSRGQFFSQLDRLLEDN